MKLTKTTVKSIKPPTEGTSDYKRGYSLDWDDDLKGFGLVCTNKGVKSYIVRARIRGVERRHTIGRANVLSADTARTLAIGWLGKIAAGGDPVAEKKQAIADGITLAMAFDTYAASPRLAASTRMNLSNIRSNLSDWLHLPLHKIDTDMVERKHQAMAKVKPGAATVAFRFFRIVWNQARITSKDATGEYRLPPCPTSVLTEKKLWVKHARRQRVIEPHQVSDWFSAVESLPELKGRAFLMCCLYTGCRRDELARLTWADVHLEGRYAVLRETKAGKHHADPDHYQPLPDQVLALLNELKQVAVGECVFGDDIGRYRGRHAFNNEIRHIGAVYGAFGPHDLRRTFISAAENLGIPSLTTKKLVNHSVSGDVTGGYLVSSVRELLPHVQRIADQIDAYRLAADNVIPLRTSH